MKKLTRAEIREADRQHCIRVGQELPASDIEAIAARVFPAGSLPDHPAPVTFTAREIEILRQTLYMTDEVAERVMDAKVRNAFARRTRTLASIQP